MLFILILIPLELLASPAEEPEETNIPILDTASEIFGMRVNTVANRFDLFFADQRADDELARSRVRINQQYTVREHSKLDDDFQIRVNIKLPRLQDRFKFEFEREKKEEGSKKKKEEAEQEAKGGTSEQIARNKLNKNWQFRADVGVNASIPPRIFTRGRLRKNMTSGDIIHRFVEELAWYSDRDWEQNSTFDSDLSLDEELLARFRNSSDWKVTRKNFTTNHGPVLLHRITDDDAFSYGTNFSTIIENSVWYVTNYRISTTYRRNLYKQWIYGDLMTGLDFPKDWSFRREPFASIRLEALFGGN